MATIPDLAPKVGPLLEPPVTVIYLDQCVLSRFVPDIDSEWKAVFEALSLGRDRRRILCPHSLEHMIESAAMSPDRSTAIDELLQSLSFGWSLQVEPLLIAAQIRSFIRETALSRDDILVAHPFRPLSDSKVHSFLASAKAGLDNFNQERNRIGNAIRALSRIEPREGWPVMMEALVTISARYAEELKHEVDEALAAGHVKFKVVPDAPHMPTWTSYVLYLLISVERFTHSELALLSHSLDTPHGLAFLPFFQVKAALQAYRAWDRQKFEPGDQYDVTRVACALPFVDMLITDGNVANAIRETRLDSIFRTEVFSTKSHERGALLHRLRQIVC